ncbi:glycosyltransferase family 4 protein [Larsenimonas rhizosphaerae]|uniref:Glycosyltransferase family 4 protein n=1 Tax=Larsenimonas rhizosphaerae TaxID=2944682 RepID=A0AA41ZD74_9GAMM|nr:glycosyltransferase family 4 protein [Larsenimonas rhizosphaerae]MCX2523172.1 glycosyltransferase family 4 protein [Larsenimonas rhizosphaerae]
MKTRILYIVTTMKRSGPINQLFQLISNLDPERYELHMISLSEEGDNSIKDRFEPFMLTMSCLGLSRYSSFFVARNSLRSAVERVEPDLVHTQDLRSDFYSLFLNGIPCVSTVHNYPYGDYPYSFGKVKGRGLAWLHLRIFSRKQRCITVSRSILKFLNKLDDPRFTFIRNGVDDTYFMPSTHDVKIRFRRDKGLPEDATVYIVSAHLTELKDPETAARAITESSGNNILVCLGDGPLRESLEQRYGGEKVRFVGYQSNVIEWLHAADAYLSASFTEGLPMGVIESLACGLPAVLSDIPAHRELHELNNDAVALFETGNVASLVQTLNKGLFSDAEQVDYRSRCALSIVRDHLSARVMAGHYQTVYDEAIKKYAGA